MLVEEAFDASKKVIAVANNLGEVRVKPARKKSTVNIAAEQILEAQTEGRFPILLPRNSNLSVIRKP